MTAIPSSTKVLDSVDIFKETGLSRIPIFEERIDNVIGILHIKDVLFFLKKHHEEAILLETMVVEIKREALFVHENKPLDQLFQEIRKHRQHMAIVLDEYGGTSGIVTMEDIFEEIFGEVRDEFDNEEDAIRPTQIPNQYLIECKIHIDDFCDFFDISIDNIDRDTDSNEFDTLAGLILHHFGQIPKYGDKLTIDNVTLEVIEVSKRRVRRVLAKVLSNGQKSEEAQSLRLKEENMSSFQQSG
ncbi:MAG: CBS domain-containing protein, partial [Silvanigrellaceae bacterium]|nr:CBS domain-containing protein [Silvanigrellaceae bacterium]